MKRDTDPDTLVKAPPSRARIGKPEETRPLQVDWWMVASVSLIHLLASLAFFSWFFSWTGLIVAGLGHVLMGTLGICVGYHRLLTHRGFECSAWLERILAIVGVLCLEDTPARWVAIHRMHHRRTDEQADPHSPLVSFLWGHMGWLFVQNRACQDISQYGRISRDLLRQPFYMWFERKLAWLLVYVAHAVMYFAVGCMIGWGIDGVWLSGVQFGSSLLVWGVFVRTVTVWHAAWFVNSIGHTWGYRNYETNDSSRNSWFVALMANGEGWHNNHHADPRCAIHGHKWWEFDLAGLTIKALEKVGLVWSVALPDRDSRNIQARRIPPSTRALN